MLINHNVKTSLIWTVKVIKTFLGHFNNLNLQKINTLVQDRYLQIYHVLKMLEMAGKYTKISPKFSLKFSPRLSYVTVNLR